MKPTHTVDAPILFVGPMVRAIFARVKTETRRLPTEAATAGLDLKTPEGRAACLARCPFGPVGRRLWVRERHAITTSLLDDGVAVVKYAADGATRAIEDPRCNALRRGLSLDKGRPSIHMPRVACRLELETTHVALENLHEVTAEGAKAEGAAWRIGEGGDLAGAFDGGDLPPINYVAHFAELWDSINGEWASWADNPLLYRVCFRVAAVLVGNAMVEVPRG